LVPPRVLERIIENGDQEQRARALKTLSRDGTIRTARVQNQKARAGGPREGADALAVSAVPKPNRIIRHADHREEVVGIPAIRREGEGPCGDEASDEAYDGLGDTWRFFNEAYGRDSIDDQGMPLRGITHFGYYYMNAFWDGRRMVFGDGDGLIFMRFTASLDVIGHELAHGVSETESGLEYYGQPGALNESFSDVMGSLVKQYRLNQDATAADWLIGSDIFTPEIDGDALRSMKAPGSAFDDPLIGKDDQPGHMSDYVRTTEDNGGVHINSGIPNHAFYITATKLGGHAWEVAGRIWYEAIQHPACGPTTQFPRFARITVRVAERLHGQGSPEVNAVHEGWEEVGVPHAV